MNLSSAPLAPLTSDHLSLAAPIGASSSNQNLAPQLGEAADAASSNPLPPVASAAVASSVSSAPFHILEIVCRDGRLFRFTGFTSLSHATLLTKQLNLAAFPLDNGSNPWAMTHRIAYHAERPADMLDEIIATAPPPGEMEDHVQDETDETREAQHDHQAHNMQHDNHRTHTLARYRQSPLTSRCVERPLPLERALSDHVAVASSRSRPPLGWRLYDVVAEYERIGVLPYVKGCAFRFTHLNASYDLTPTYPRLLVVPTSASDEIISMVAQYRTRGRFPTLSWLSRVTGGVLYRSSQPGTGFVGRRSPHDEELLRLMRGTARNDALPLLIVDARPRVNAEMNRAWGGGYENVANYDSTQLEFFGIGASI